jgi:hypothetical protein
VLIEVKATLRLRDILVALIFRSDGTHLWNFPGVTGVYSLSNLTQYPLRYFQALRSTAVDPIPYNNFYSDKSVSRQFLNNLIPELS